LLTGKLTFLELHKKFSPKFATEQRFVFVLVRHRLPGEKANPYNWNTKFKWVFTVTCALVTLCIAFASSCYSGAATFLVAEFHVSEEVVILGISLYVSARVAMQCTHGMNGQPDLFSHYITLLGPRIWSWSIALGTILGDEGSKTSIPRVVPPLRSVQSWRCSC
jgi:hypothetical protein